MHSLTCIMGLNTDPFNGKLTSVRVCAHCQRKNRETAFLEAYLKTLSLGMEDVSHGICPSCYQTELDKLKVG